MIGDKAHCSKGVQSAMAQRAGLRAPFESVFSKWEKRASYRSTAKVQIQIFLEATVFNVIN